MTATTNFSFQAVLRMRAECAPDVDRLLLAAANLMHTSAGIHSSSVELDDFGEATLTVELRAADQASMRAFFARFLGLFHKVDDVHVMFQTLAPASSYTGERVYDATGAAHMARFLGCVSRV
jgi:tRNA threonylcarbamoyladenosine modification (KEOPS) complex  Pcc1 subunit